MLKSSDNEMPAQMPVPVRGEALVEALESLTESTDDPVAAAVLRNAARELETLAAIVEIRLERAEILEARISPEFYWNMVV